MHFGGCGETLLATEEAQTLCSHLLCNLRSCRHLSSRWRSLHFYQWSGVELKSIECYLHLTWVKSDKSWSPAVSEPTHLDWTDLDSCFRPTNIRADTFTPLQSSAKTQWVESYSINPYLIILNKERITSNSREWSFRELLFSLLR